MQPSGLSSGRFRFGAFVLDVRTGELRKGSTRLRIPDQSIEVLKALLERPGELVTREELRQRLWAGDTFVDFEQGLNGIMRRLREALGDSADAPTFIETLPRRGYRFIGVLEPEDPATLPASPDPPTAESRARRVNVRAVTFVIIGLGAAAVLGAFAAWSLRQPVDGPAARAIPVTSYPGLEVDPSVSPDGRQVVYAWDNDGDNFDIYVKLIGRDEHLRLTTNPAVERRPVWSPDGQRIAFLRQRLNARGSTIVVVPALGGPEQPVTETLVAPGSPPSTNGLSWTPDSKGLLFLDAVQGRLNLAVFILWIDS
jgi:DNA-binding winged helix-turn-helix (wHTH) protein